MALSCYFVIGIRNNSAGNVIFNGTATASNATQICGGTAGSNSFTIPAGSYAICYFSYNGFPPFSMYVWNFTLI
jgi:hypothetical protein